MDGFKPHTPVMRYHVFLSFRGKDVRKTLVDHLFQALSAAGLNVFLDSHKLKKGEIIDISLKKAIECSAICIPIFSEGYAGSAWCLREAALMLASPGLIIPLFYQTEPTHVRYPEGNFSPYAQSFEKHYSHPDRHSREEIDEWKHVLKEICSRSGWSLDMTGGMPELQDTYPFVEFPVSRIYLQGVVKRKNVTMMFYKKMDSSTTNFEAQLVKKVVNDIIKTLDKVPLQVARYPVGLEAVKLALIQKLHLNSAKPVAKLGICGIGGIGKTTVAKALYNGVYSYFVAASFVFNVRSTCLKKLQAQILKDFVNYDEDLCSVEKGMSMLRDRLRGVHALVILDDVDDRAQLDALAVDWLYPGCHLIITSRDRHILNAAHIPSECIHEITGLGESESLQLFSWHAFLRSSPVPRFEELSKRIVEACKGHPLSLEVIGAFLYDKQDQNDIDCWNETLENISVNRDIFKTLYTSYSGLSAEEKEILLDIACFFIGESTTSPILFWKSMYKNVRISITNLSMKLLIKIDDKGVFNKHDLIRDMGRTIAEEEQTRQWQTAQSSSSLDNISNINVSRLCLCKSDSQCLKKLCTPTHQYLHLEHMHIEDGIDSLPPSLRWLKVDSCSFPSMMQSLNLFKNLILATKKKSTSAMSSNTSQLRIMDLINCRSLQNLPEIIGHFSHLQSLNLSGSQKLDCLPNTISNLSELVYLNLCYCEKLRYLPDGIGNLSQLEYLNLTCCKILIELPDSIGKLSQLKHLSLSWCQKLKNLPESIGKLSKLERLDMLSCYSAWKSIPHDILIQSKLSLLGLPPEVDNWRKNLIAQGCVRENEEQMEERTTQESSLLSREAMAEFWAILAPECDKLESKLTKIRFFPGKNSFQNRSRLQLKLPGKASKEKLDFTHPMDTRSATTFSTDKSSIFREMRSYPGI